MLVSALGQRDGDGAALLGLCVCRGLMEELRLFRMALGAAELASAWAAVAPRKPERRAGQGRRRQRDGEVGGGSSLEISRGNWRLRRGEKKTSRGSYFAGIPSNCHQRHGQAERKEYLKFRQGRGREKKENPAHRACPGDR